MNFCYFGIKTCGNRKMGGPGGVGLLLPPPRFYKNVIPNLGFDTLIGLRGPFEGLPPGVPWNIPVETHKKIWKRFKINKKGCKRLKKRSSTSFWLRAARKSWLKYTTLLTNRLILTAWKAALKSRLVMSANLLLYRALVRIDWIARPAVFVHLFFLKPCWWESPVRSTLLIS